MKLQPTMYGRNQELFDEMLRQGKTYVCTETHHYFTNPDHSYFGFPKGFITGPQYSRGTPTPVCMSVNGPNGWLQRSGTLAEIDILTAWAVKIQDRILSGTL